MVGPHVAQRLIVPDVVGHGMKHQAGRLVEGPLRSATEERRDAKLIGSLVVVAPNDELVFVLVVFVVEGQLRIDIVAVVGAHALGIALERAPLRSRVAVTVCAVNDVASSL
jgi:hypothetical protein